MNRRTLGYVTLAAFVACVVVANYAVSHWGTPPTFPGGPYTITLFGLTAPSAVLVVGVSFTLRDAAQALTSRAAVAAAIVVGALLSWAVSPGAVALGSAIAFGVSETLDLAVYTPLADRGRWLSALAASNTVGAAVDTLLFLTIAFGWSSLALFYWPQFWLKALMTVPAVLILAPWRLRSRAILARRT
jgi:uncharacterized PurR-regulated membrane protein YhhQ (DUF165 family)